VGAQDALAALCPPVMRGMRNSPTILACPSKISLSPNAAEFLTVGRLPAAPYLLPGKCFGTGVTIATDFVLTLS
jgi:hypothetical protein